MCQWGLNCCAILMVIDPDDGDIYETLILNATLTRLIIHKNFRTSLMSVIVPYVYPLLRMQFEYVELLLLFLMASLCSVSSIKCYPWFIYFMLPIV